MKKTLTFLIALFVLSAVNAQTDLIISEYGEGWGSNKYLELFNPTDAAINLSAYSIVRYSNGGQTFTSPYQVSLPDVSLEPYKTYVISQDKKNGEVSGDDSPLWQPLEDRVDYFVNSSYDDAVAGSKCIQWNGNDAVALFKGDALVDLFGQVGVNPASALVPGSSEGSIQSWSSEPNYDDGNGIGLSADHGLVRKSSVTTGVTVNPDGFNILAEYDSIAVNTFSHLGWHKFDGAPDNSTPSLSLDEVYAVSPFASEGDLILTLEAQDSDAGQTMKYYILDGNYFKDTVNDVAYTPFALDKLTGEITVADENALPLIGYDIYMEVAVNDEYAESEAYSFYIRVTDEELAISEFREIESSLSPNPTQNQFVVKAVEPITELSVYSLTGQEVYHQVVNAKEISVNVNLAAGSYIVRSSFADKGQSIEKLIIE